MSNNKYVYHYVPEDMNGTILYPLNQLKSLLPDAATRHVDKYSARPELMEKKLEILDCLWNDVLHFVAVPPEEIKRLYIEADFTKASKKINKLFKIPVEILDSAKTIVYTWTKEVDHFETSEDIRAMREFNVTLPFDSNNLEEYAKSPRTTLAYYKFIKRTGQKQFMIYHFTPHILYKGTIDTTGLEIVEV